LIDKTLLFNVQSIRQTALYVNAMLTIDHDLKGCMSVKITGGLTRKKIKGKNANNFCVFDQRLFFRSSTEIRSLDLAPLAMNYFDYFTPDKVLNEAVGSAHSADSLCIFL